MKFTAGCTGVDEIHYSIILWLVTYRWSMPMLSAVKTAELDILLGASAKLLEVI